MPDDLAAPAGPCHRIGWEPAPLAFPDWVYCGQQRFDDPSGTQRYRVLYTGERRASFHEALSRYRPGRLSGIVKGEIPPEWFATRRIGTLMLGGSSKPQKWLDLRSPVTYDAFDDVFADMLKERKIDWFDASRATDDDRDLSQAIGRWAYESGYHGIEYMSRRHLVQLCWAIFEGTLFMVHDPGNPIARDDFDLLEVARIWHLTILPP